MLFSKFVHAIASTYHHSFLFTARNVPLHGYTTFYLSAHLLMDVWRIEKDRWMKYFGSVLPLLFSFPIKQSLWHKNWARLGLEWASIVKVRALGWNIFSDQKRRRVEMTGMVLSAGRKIKSNWSKPAPFESPEPRVCSSRTLVISGEDHAIACACEKLTPLNLPVKSYESFLKIQGSKPKKNSLLMRQF